jgi:hypothetical protein
MTQVFYGRTVKESRSPFSADHGSAFPEDRLETTAVIGHERFAGDIQYSVSTRRANLPELSVADGTPMSNQQPPSDCARLRGALAITGADLGRLAGLLSPPPWI